MNTNKDSSKELSIVAITVSTNYEDLLRYLLPENLSIFDKWIIVTDKRDINTQKLLNMYPEVKVMLINFQSPWRIFNKGKGIKKGQIWAYKNFPDSWYVILDSDILLSKGFSRVVRSESVLNSASLYGSNIRLDFKKMSDLKNRTNFYKYQHQGEIHGYFQLYREKLLYKDSIDASACDLEFSNRFRQRILLDGFMCDHLGVKGNWEGRMTKDFDFDI